MEVLFHFIFELVKISILASVYSLILLIVFRQINKSNSYSWFQKVTVNSKKFWLSSGSIIFGLLFIWMFTYWGDHGLGDSARIPIGHGKEIEEINGNWSFISPNGHENEKFTIKSFAVRSNYCVGMSNKDQTDYFIWNLSTNDIEKFTNLEEYSEKVISMNLPDTFEFKDFDQAYDEFWGGWIFWLLP